MKSKGRLLSMFMVFIALILFSVPSLAGPVRVYEVQGGKIVIVDIKIEAKASGKGSTCEVIQVSQLKSGESFSCAAIAPEESEQY